MNSWTHPAPRYCDLNKTLDLISRSRSIHGSEMDVWKVILEGKASL